MHIRSYDSVEAPLDELRSLLVPVAQARGEEVDDTVRAYLRNVTRLGKHHEQKPEDLVSWEAVRRALSLLPEVGAPRSERGYARVRVRTMCELTFHCIAAERLAGGAIGVIAICTLPDEHADRREPASFVVMAHNGFGLVTRRGLAGDNREDFRSPICEARFDRIGLA